MPGEDIDSQYFKYLILDFTLMKIFLTDLILCFPHVLIFNTHIIVYLALLFICWKKPPHFQYCCLFAKWWFLLLPSYQEKVYIPLIHNYIINFTLGANITFISAHVHINKDSQHLHQNTKNT